MKIYKIYLYFSNGDLKIVSSWEEASKYTWRDASVYNSAGKIIKKYQNY